LQHWARLAAVICVPSPIGTQRRQIAGWSKKKERREERRPWRPEAAKGEGEKKNSKWIGRCGPPDFPGARTPRYGRITRPEPCQKSAAHPQGAQDSGRRAGRRRWGLARQLARGSGCRSRRAQGRRHADEASKAVTRRSRAVSGSFHFLRCGRHVDVGGKVLHRLRRKPTTDSPQSTGRTASPETKGPDAAARAHRPD
jgi:hypothetical protein